MALRNQPYFPLYVQDYLTDEKLNMCSLSSQGFYIKLLCIMHKSEHYGKILLKQKDKQTESKSLNFAYKIAKILPIPIDSIKEAIEDLLDEHVIYIEGDYLCQKRMIKDNEISLIRSKAGKKGGESTQKFAKAKNKANTEIENEDVNEIEDKNKDVIVWPSFSDFWDLYDKKTDSKDKCEKKWNRLSQKVKEKIMEHLPLYVISTPEKQFRKNPSTYLNNEGWTHEIIQTNSKNGKGFTTQAGEYLAKNDPDWKNY